MPLPAENSAMSTPSKDVSVSSSMTTFWPRKSMVLPAERARQRDELADREVAPLEGGDEFGADRAGGADDGNNNGFVAHGSILFG